jgi:hypothetical protein
MTERRSKDIAPKRGSAFPRLARVYAIRAWREQPVVSESLHVFGVGMPPRSLRKERSLSGQRGYDLNRHIMLVRQQKNASQRKAFCKS